MQSADSAAPESRDDDDDDDVDYVAECAGAGTGATDPCGIATSVRSIVGGAV